LYAAGSVGLHQNDIFMVLDKLAKNLEIPDEVKETIKIYSSQYGKAKLVLKDNKYFIEAVDEETMKNLTSKIDIVRLA
jgi:DNA excision repair protein ERCC-3